MFTFGFVVGFIAGALLLHLIKNKKFQEALAEERRTMGQNLTNARQTLKSKL